VVWGALMLIMANQLIRKEHVRVAIKISILVDTSTALIITNKITKKTANGLADLAVANFHVNDQYHSKVAI